MPSFQKPVSISAISSAKQSVIIPEITNPGQVFTDSEMITPDIVGQAVASLSPSKREGHADGLTNSSTAYHGNLAGISHNPWLGFCVLSLLTFCVLFTDNYGGVARIAMFFSAMTESYSEMFEEAYAKVHAKLPKRPTLW